jgi:uncharacterized iron-regulated protein
MSDLFSMEAFLKEQPQCNELTGEKLEIAYQRWLDDIYNELMADSVLARMKEQNDWDNV